jgi:hypothetical protein
MQSSSVFAGFRMAAKYVHSTAVSGTFCNVIFAQTTEDDNIMMTCDKKLLILFSWLASFQQLQQPCPNVS